MRESVSILSFRSSRKVFLEKEISYDYQEGGTCNHAKFQMFDISFNTHD